jgi:hypothetical protein
MKTRDYKASRYYSPEEDRVIIDCVKRNPQNLREAFSKASRILETRSENSVKIRWSRFLSKQESNNCFMTLGRNTRNVNRKIVRVNSSDNTETIKLSIWNKILKLFK